MAPRSNVSLAKLYVLFLFAILSCPSKAYSHPQLKKTNLTFYLHDYFGPNGTTALVTGIAGQKWSFFSFGTIYVSDDPLTVGPHKNSPQIGRVQGIYIISSPDAINALIMDSIVFTNREYNGSTLQLQGRFLNLAPPGETVGEVAVVGGTGKFRFASGFAIFDFVYYDPTLTYSVLRCNVTVRHYY